MGTLTGRLVASKKSVIRFRWMITVWIGRTSRWDEEMSEEEGVDFWELTFDEEDEEEEEEEMEECEVREERMGRRRNSNILRQILLPHH